MPLLHRSASRILMSLPRPTRPHLTTSSPSKPRPFHLSAVGDAVVLTANGISAVHNAGLPWYLSIPLVAIGVNFTFRLPIQYYTRRLVVRRNLLNPLVSAWSTRHSASVSQAFGSGPGGHAQRDRLWGLRVARLTEKSRRRIYKTWGVQRWKTLAPFLTMLPFVVVSEALRRLCGAPAGWISHQLGLASMGNADAGSVSGASSLATTLSDTSGLFDAQLAHGGCLWFVDLTAMDPYYILPLTCSALLARTSWSRLSKEQLGALLNPDKPSSSSSANPAAGALTPMVRIQRSIGRVLLLVPLFPILFADLPSAIFLYWATTFALSDLNESILQRLVPKRTPALKTIRRVPPALPYLRGGNMSNKG
ncbi:hypothetical protein E4U55_007757 [Claviceps digitariae]|nr:hypothetical protein E4U55_007757 [Claviceps digitariae]